MVVYPRRGGCRAHAVQTAEGVLAQVLATVAGFVEPLMLLTLPSVCRSFSAALSRTQCAWYSSLMHYFPVDAQMVQLTPSQSRDAARCSVHAMRLIKQQQLSIQLVALPQLASSDQPHAMCDRDRLLSALLQAATEMHILLMPSSSGVPQTAEWAGRKLTIEMSQFCLGNPFEALVAADSLPEESAPSLIQQLAATRQFDRDGAMCSYVAVGVELQSIMSCW